MQSRSGRDPTRPATVPPTGAIEFVRVRSHLEIKQKREAYASLFYLVPVTGLEPVRCRQRWILSPLRLPFHHTGRCVIFLHRPPPLAMNKGGRFQRRMSPSFAVPDECPRLSKAFVPRRPLHLLRPRLPPPQAALGLAPVDFESTTSTIPSHRQVYWDSIIHLSKNSKQKYSR